MGTGIGRVRAMSSMLSDHAPRLAILGSLLAVAACSDKSAEAVGSVADAIRNGTVFPNPVPDETLVSIHFKNASGIEPAHCSGVLIGADGRAVLTAAHCINETREYAVSFNQPNTNFFDLRNTLLVPGRTYSRTRLYTGWVKGQPNDMGVLFLDPAIGRVGAELACLKEGPSFPTSVEVRAAALSPGTDSRQGVKNSALFNIDGASFITKYGGFAVFPNLFPPGGEQWVIGGDSGSPVYDTATLGETRPDLVGIIYGEFRLPEFDDPVVIEGMGTQIGRKFCGWLAGDVLDLDVLASFQYDVDFDGEDETAGRVARVGDDWDVSFESPIFGDLAFTVPDVDPSLDPEIITVGSFLGSGVQLFSTSTNGVVLTSLTNPAAPSLLPAPPGAQFVSLLARPLDGDLYQDVLAITDRGEHVVYWGGPSGVELAENTVSTTVNYDPDGLIDTVTVTPNNVHVSSSTYITGVGTPYAFAVPGGMGNPVQIVPGYFRSFSTTDSKRQDFAVVGSTGRVLYCRSGSIGDTPNGCSFTYNSTSPPAIGLAVTDANNDGIDDLEVIFDGATPRRVHYGSANGLTSGNNDTQVGIPSASADDGRFLTISGQGFLTVDEPHLSMKLVVPSSETQFNVAIFDGDLSGFNDDVVETAPATGTRACYVLWTDPCGDRTLDCFSSPGSAAVRIARRGVDSEFLDNAWSSLGSLATEAAARAPSGNYVYRLDSFLTNRTPTATPGDACDVTVDELSGAADREANVINGFKVRSTGALSVRGGVLSFMAMDRAGTFGSSVAANFGWQLEDREYDGSFDFFFDVGDAVESTLSIGLDTRELVLTEADADHPDAVPAGRGTGASRDTSFFVESPALGVVLERPDGDLLPSGNYEPPTGGREEHSIPDPEGGLWQWGWRGVHSINNIHIRAVAASPTAFELFGSATPRAPETSALSRSVWQSSSFVQYLPVVVGSSGAGGVPLGRSISVTSQSQGVAVLSGAQGAFPAELLAAKLNLAQAAGVGERLSNALVYGASITLRSVIARADEMMSTFGDRATNAEQADLLILLGALNAGQSTYFRPEVPYVDRDDGDDDGDEVPNATDNCPSLPNPDQFDSDADNIGDACSVTPLATCQVSRGGSARTVYLGYDNPLSFRYIPIGSRNRFSTGAIDRQQPMEFAAGRVPRAFPLNFIAGAPFAWNLDVGSVTISSSTPACSGFELLDVPFADRIALYGRDEVLLRDRAEVRDGTGRGDVASGGFLEVGGQARSGDLWASGVTAIRSQATVSGNVISGQSVSLQAGATITGTVTSPSYVPAHSLAWSVAFPASGSNVIIEPGQPPRTIAPGSYGEVNLKAGTELRLSAGTYFFRTLNLEPGALLKLNDATGPVVIYVRDSLRNKGTNVSQSGAPPKLLVGYFGTAAAFLESPVSGAVIAPNAQIVLGTDNNGMHRGVYFAKRVELRSPAIVVYTPPAE